MRVAAVQFAPSFKEYDANLQSIRAFVKAAASHQAELVVLPELATTGYSFMSEEEAMPFAEDLTNLRVSDSVRVLTQLSASLGVAIAWGFVEKDSGTGSLYNAQALVLPTGARVSYRKLNPWGNDYLWTTRGRASPPILSYRGKNVGLLICRDVRDKAKNVENLYMPGDADIVCFSANWGDGGFPSGTWISFAEENHAWLVVSNRYGREENNNFGEGGICVIAPTGKVHCEGLAWDRPCIVYFDVP